MSFIFLFPHVVLLAILALFHAAVQCAPISRNDNGSNSSVNLFHPNNLQVAPGPGVSRRAPTNENVEVYLVDIYLMRRYAKTEKEHWYLKFNPESDPGSLHMFGGWFDKKTRTEIERVKIDNRPDVDKFKVMTNPGSQIIGHIEHGGDVAEAIPLQQGVDWKHEHNFIADLTKLVGLPTKGKPGKGQGTCMEWAMEALQELKQARPALNLAEAQKNFKSVYEKDSKGVYDRTWGYWRDVVEKDKAAKEASHASTSGVAKKQTSSSSHGHHS